MSLSELVSLIGGDAAPVYLSSDTVITPDGQTVTLHVGNRQIHLTADQAAQIAAAATAEALTAEIQARETGEAALKADIETEASERQQSAAGETAERQGADNVLQAQIEDEMSYREAGDTENAQAVADETSRAQDAEAGIQAKYDPLIPSTATAANQLVDTDKLNSSIDHMAAHRITYDPEGNPFPTRAAAWGATEVYHGGASYIPTEHDYLLITADEGAPAPYTGGQTRHEYDGSKWAYAYGINERPFTAEENAVLDSKATQPLIDALKEIIGYFTGGSANTAAKLATARTLIASDSSTTMPSFDGSSGVTIGVLVTVAAGTETNVMPTTSKQTLRSWLTAARNVLAWLVARFDASGNPNGKAATAGAADTSAKWAAARTITVNGDVSGSVSVDGSANKTLSLTLSAGVTQTIAAKQNAALSAAACTALGVASGTTLEDALIAVNNRKGYVVNMTAQTF
ncbi:MAG: hypothetical protein LBR72_06040 [Oscillospiraceae bacterium]|jgi:hypothetical protein|nr:hypothetical protein [Oscillospiraceae bacterium]